MLLALYSAPWETCPLSSSWVGASQWLIVMDHRLLRVL